MTGRRGRRAALAAAIVVSALVGTGAGAVALGADDPGDAPAETSVVTPAVRVTTALSRFGAPLAASAVIGTAVGAVAPAIADQPEVAAVVLDGAAQAQVAMVDGAEAFATGLEQVDAALRPLAPAVNAVANPALDAADDVVGVVVKENVPQTAFAADYVSTLIAWARR